MAITLEKMQLIGYDADFTIFNIEKGTKKLKDLGGNIRETKELIYPIHTIIGGISMTTIYDKYDLNKVINASGKMTALGVSKYIDEAIDAQKFAGKNFFEMDKLNINVGNYIANLLGAEDSQIVSSASAGIAQSIAAIIGKGSQYHLYHPCNI